MRWKHFASLLGWAIVLTSASPAPAVGSGIMRDDSKADGLARERERHQGTWNVISFESNGVVTAPGIMASIERIVEGDHVVWKRDGKRFAGTAVVLEPTSDPKTIDVIPDGGKSRDQHVLGIYKLEGDILTICMAEPEKPRPKKFNAEKGSRLTLMKFERKASRR